MTNFPLRDIVGTMSGANPAACEVGLEEMGAYLGLSHVGFVPDIARPYYSPAADAFFRRQGWPDDLLRVWWERSGSIKTGLYVRCRFAALPFIVDLEGERRAEGQASADEREMTRLFCRHGLSTLLAVPVHLPRGSIALLVLAGAAAPGDLRNGLPTIVPDLLAAGHLVAAAWDRDAPVITLGEEASRLTRREWDCLRLLAQGFRDAQIAGLNGIAPTTVRYHVDNVVRKLGAVNRVHAVALAAQLGLLGPLGD